MYAATPVDATAQPRLPANVLIAGTYAKALLEENGGEPTREFQMAYQEYTKQREEARNRFTADTGTPPIA